MRDLAMRRGLSNVVRVDSAATTTEEIGNPVHAGARRVLAAHNVACVGHKARQVTRDEYKSWDLIVAMDDENVHDLMRIFKHDKDGKIHKLMEYAPSIATNSSSTNSSSAPDVADPWYTGNFEAAYCDIAAGCEGIIDHLR